MRSNRCAPKITSSWISTATLCRDPKGIAPAAEIKLYTHVYKTRPEVGGIVHAHPRFATVMSVVNIPMSAWLKRYSFTSHWRNLLGPGSIGAPKSETGRNDKLLTASVPKNFIEKRVVHDGPAVRLLRELIILEGNVEKPLHLFETHSSIGGYGR